MPLSDAKVRSAKPGAKAVKLFDAATSAASISRLPRAAANGGG
jgi:hypothetical protein